MSNEYFMIMIPILIILIGLDIIVQILSNRKAEKRIQIIRLIMEIIIPIVYTIYTLSSIIDVCTTEYVGNIIKILYFIIFVGIEGFLIIAYGIQAIETFNIIKAIDRKVIKFPKKYNKKK